MERSNEKGIEEKVINSLTQNRMLAAEIERLCKAVDKRDQELA